MTTAVTARASTFGAVSIVNAIAGGKGATASIKLPTEAKVTLENSGGSWEVLVNGKPGESGLAVETARLAIERAGGDPQAYSGRIETSSAAPIGVGLKTSSASSTAIAIAVSAAVGHKGFDPKKVLDCSVQASLASGASITGALDDAAGCLLGGINMTDNIARRVVSSRLFDKKLKVLILVPNTKSQRGAVDLQFIRKFGGLTDIFFDMSLRGDYWTAMVLNGMAYSSILKYDPSPALRAVELGALGAGLSGTGPATAAVFDPSRRAETEALKAEWEAEGGKVIETETNNEHGRLLEVG